MYKRQGIERTNLSGGAAITRNLTLGALHASITLGSYRLTVAPFDVEVICSCNDCSYDGSAIVQVDDVYTFGNFNGSANKGNWGNTVLRWLFFTGKDFAHRDEKTKDLSGRFSLE